jgi:DNA mismatch repair ATPase MutL
MMISSRIHHFSSSFLLLPISTMEPTTSTATANTTTTITPASATVQASQSSSSETNKKRNNHRRRNNTNKNKARPATEETSTSQTTKQQPKKKEPLKGFKNPKLEDQDDEEADGEVCFICTRPIDYYSVAPCNHRTCHLCTLRLRALYKTKNCAYCKVKLIYLVGTCV